MMTERPMMKSTHVGNYLAQVFYETERARWRIEVTNVHTDVRVTEWIAAVHDPVFGIDAEDLDHINATADAIVTDMESGEET